MRGQPRAFKASAMSGPSAHRAIMLRRAEEDRIGAHVAAARSRDKALVMAHFEQRTQARIEQRTAKARVARSKAALDADLDRRRRRLADLLEDEQEAFEREIESSFETPEQRKERLFARAKALRAAREEERKKRVEELNFQRLRESTDDLRSLDSRAVLLRATEERASQLEEAEEAKRKAAAEAVIHNAKWEELRLKKIEREKREAREAAARNEDMVLALEAQRRLRTEILDTEKKAEDDNAKRMLSQWAAEEQAERDAIKAKAEAAAEERLRVRLDNEVTAARRAKEAGKEAEEDEARLRATLEREAAEDRAEAEEHERRRLEAIEHRKRLEEQMAVEKEEANELDALYAAEQDKEWGKREAQWRAESDAREALMRDVDASRRENIAKKEAAAKKAREEDAIRAIKNKEEMVKEEAEQAAIAAKLRAKNLAHQKDLFNQMKLVEDKAQRERQAVYLEGKLMKRAEETYQDRLAAMKSAGLPEQNHRRKTARWYD